MKPSILFYGCEIINVIPQKNVNHDTRYQYCDGWGDFANMGVSVIGTYSNVTEAYRATNDIDEFGAMVKAHDLLVGFNSKRFDDKLLAANGLRVTTDYDLYEEISLSVGKSKGRKYNLEAICEANSITSPLPKLGALAPQLWQDGEIEMVAQYCLEDVRRTKDCCRLALQGRLIDPNNGNFIKTRALQNVKTMAV